MEPTTGGESVNIDGASVLAKALKEQVSFIHFVRNIRIYFLIPQLV